MKKNTYLCSLNNNEEEMKIRAVITTIATALLCLSASAYNDHRNVRIDSLEAVLMGSNPPKGEDLLRAYNELMRGYLPYDSVKCEYYARKSLALSYLRNALYGRQSALRHLGLLRYGREDYDAAIGYFRQALSVTDTMATDKRYTEKDIDDARSALYGTIANVYNMQDKAHLAIHYYQLALPIFEKYDWLESQTILYHNIGELYNTMGNSAEAERNYLLAMEKAEQSGDSLLMALPRKGLVKIYIGQGNYEKACEVAKWACTYYKRHHERELGDYPEILSALVRINMMDGHQNLPQAKAFAQEALSLANDGMMFETLADIYAANCEVAMAEGQWQQALGYGLRSIHPDSAATYSDKDCYRLLAGIYTELGQKEEARHYINKMYDLMNRYATDHYQSGLSQMEVLYETEKKEARIASLDTEQRQQQRMLWLAWALLATAVALIIYSHVAHRRQKALLAAKVALDTETRERSIIARDLHDTIGGMLSVLRIKSLTPAPSPTGEGSDYLKLLDATIAELRRVAHHLMPEELLHGGLVSALHDFAVSVPGTRFQAIGDIRLSQDMELVLYRCAYELVNNAQKHAAANRIDIQLMQEDGQVVLTVSDDGKGMAENSEHHTFNSQQNNGMGLKNIRARIGRFNGQLNIVTAENSGTEINIILPL